MEIKDGYYKWNKNEKGNLSPHFGMKEFACQCKNEDCLEQSLSLSLINKLELLRTIVNKPIRVNSGYRCHKHQLALAAGGKETAVGISTHELGHAADISCPELIIQDLTPFVDKFFDSYGVAWNFIHCDLRPKRANGSKRIWYYSSAPGKF